MEKGVTNQHPNVRKTKDEPEGGERNNDVSNKGKSWAQEHNQPKRKLDTKRSPKNSLTTPRSLEETQVRGREENERNEVSIGPYISVGRGRGPRS